MAERYAPHDEEALRDYISKLDRSLNAASFFVKIMEESRKQFKKILPQQIEIMLREIKDCNKYLVARPLSPIDRLQFVARLPQTGKKEYDNAIVFAQAPSLNDFVETIGNHWHRSYLQNFEALANTGLLIPKKGSSISSAIHSPLN